MDYDTTDIPASYDLGRDHGPAETEQWMEAISAHVDAAGVNRILDLGCGTGRFSEALASHFEAEVVGIDPSHKMLECAQSKPASDRVRYLRGRGEAIPLDDASVDLVFISMVFHHFEQPDVVAGECARVLRRGGGVFLRAGTREKIDDYAYVPFFPASRALLEATLVSAASIRSVFESAGFQTVGFDAIRQEISPNFTAYAEKLSHGADSILVQLDQEDFDAGIEALREYGARTGTDTAVGEPVDYFVFQTDA